MAYNPFASTGVPGVEAPPAEGRPYPNLASVPRPVRESPDAAAERQRELAALIEERDAAIEGDRVLRETGALPPPPAPAAAPEPPPPAVIPPISLPATAAPQVAQAAPPAARAPAGSQRMGSITFTRALTTLTDASRAALAAAGAQARTQRGAVRLTPALFGSETISPAASAARRSAIVAALGAGTQVSIGEDLGRRVEVYDIYIEN